MLVLRIGAYEAMVGHCLDGFPLEACGLILGRPDADGTALAEVCRPAGNLAASARVFTVEPRDLLRADRDAEAAGLELVGVYHSHTHTDAYPSPTDVAAAPDPGWHYVVVSLRDSETVVRSYRITDGKIREEPVVLQ